MRSLNVLMLSHLYPSAPYPALGPFVRDEVLELAKRHRIHVISPLSVPLRRPALARRAFAARGPSIQDGVPVTRPLILTPPLGGLRIAGPLWARRLARPLRRAYRELPADLVHAHFALPDGLAAARFARGERAPFVLTVRGSDVLISARQAAARRLLVETLAQANAIVAVSDQLANEVQQLGVRPEIVRVIPGGIPYESALDRQSTRRRLRIPHESVCILWVGGFVPVKQPVDAIRALELLDARLPGQTVRLVMIGDGPLRRPVEDLLRRSHLEDAVELTGHIPRRDVWTWMCAADLLVNSSSSEGTPMAVLEALGAGTPVAAYPLAGIHAVVGAVDGGTIAAGGAPQELAAAIGDELAAGRDRVRLAAAARQHFDIVHAAEAIEEVYAAVV
jgi:teichuronic acid biosynthesis glycosyltransferase TuaC